MTIKGFTSSKLIESIRAGRLSGVIDALEAGADIEEADMHGSRGLPLRTACFAGNEAIVRELLAHGANPDATASDGPGAPLRLALRGDHPEIVALLLQWGARVPEGIAIDPSILERQCPPVTGDTPIHALPGNKPDNVIEFTRAEVDLATEDNDSSESFGTKTNALSMDLLFLDEEDAPSKSPGKEDQAGQA